jgi:hypothetical protein
MLKTLLTAACSAVRIQGGQYINEVRHQRRFDDGFFGRFSFSKWHLVNAMDAFPSPGHA